MSTKPKAAAKKPAAKKPAAKKPAAAPKAKKPTAKKKPDAVEASPEVFVPHHEIAEIIGAEVITSAPRAEDVEDAEIVDVEAEVAASPPPELSDEEREVAAVYGEDLAASAPTAHVEYSDRQTADEDRPMVPEINAREERKNRWEGRREQRRSRRDRGGRPDGGGDGRPPQQGQQQRHDGQQQQRAPQHQQAQQNHPQQRLPLPTPGDGAAPVAPATVTSIHEHDALARVGTPLGDAATSVFAQLRNNQPLPVKQLAAMMRKRNLVAVDPDQLWPQLKAELLGDERSYRSLGLRPRIIYRGRDLFAPGPVATSMTADAEAGMAAALSRLAGATHRALAQRVARATPSGFERLIHAYLVAAGYRDIDWVKRVDGISYAAVTAPGIERTVLVSARSGDRPIDRRGIGELRVGVEAKNLVAGILFSAAGLSEDAEKELEKAGRSVSVVCGDQLVATLVAAGVGVVSRTAPLHYVDDQLLDELMQG